MTALTYYQLQPRPGGGFHFGEQGLELETSRLVFPSDSLFAALTATIAQQEGTAAATQFVAPFDPTQATWQGEPPCRFTSLFPFVGRLPLLPLPHLRIPMTKEANLPRKFAKKVRFVSPHIWHALCQGMMMDEFVDETKHGRFLQAGAVWLTAAECAALPPAWASLNRRALKTKSVWQQGEVPRVTLDRASSSSAIYLMGRVTFNQGCGLWLGITYHQSSWRSRIENLLHHLGDRGIGGERSNGYGGFTPLPADLIPPLPDTPSPTAGPVVLLSRCHPQSAEIDALQAPSAAYRLVTVGGWLSSPGHPMLRRQRVTLLAEGSVLGRPVQGGLVDVRPTTIDFPHAVYRNGFALTAPVKTEA